MQLHPYDKLRAIRGNARASAGEYIQGIFTDFIELHGDRRFADDPAIVGGLADLGGQPVTVIAIEKGKDLADRVKRNFGLPKPEGYRKALRLMRQAEKFGRPIICFVDTAGAYCGADAEERGQGLAIAENLVELMAVHVPVITVVFGEGGSGGALALSVANRVLMLENAVFSVISPEGCASILWKDSAKAPEAAECLRITAEDMVSFGVADEIVHENFADLPAMCCDMRRILSRHLDELQAMSPELIREQRYAKYRAIGEIAPIA